MVKQLLIKRIVFAGLFFLLCFPYIQSKLTIIKLLPLNGVFEKINNPPFEFKEWFGGEYQKEYNKFTDQNIGFRNFFVRVFNQIDYSLFNLSHVKDLVIGKDGYLFHQGYFDSYHGKNYENDFIYEQKLITLVHAQNILKEKGIDLVTILAPTKARFFSEYADKFNAKAEKKYSHYDYLKKHYRELGLNVIDFNKWFLEMKNTSPYPLFPKQGIHWSYYGAARVVDSLIHYLETTHNAKMNDYSYSLVQDTVAGTDYDLGDLMNLFFKLQPNKMAYPKFTFSNTTGRWKPRILVIGDSFYWTLYNWDIFKNLSSTNDFWYYNKTMYPEKGVIEDLNIEKEIFNYDIILLLQSEPGYANPGYSFPENLVTQMENSRRSSEEFIIKIRGNEGLMVLATKKSNILNKKIDEVVLQMADSLARLKDARIFEIVRQIRNTPQWFEQVKQKAKNKNISIDEMIKEDARWLCDKENFIH